MIRYLLDTRCLVAAVCSWHEHHAATAADIARRHRARQRVVLAGPSLAEAYAVLTRLPPPHRLSPGDAWAVIDGNWSDAAVASLSEHEWRITLRAAVAADVRGGQTYDAVIAACARKARVAELVTWNLAHFVRVAADLSVVAPDGNRGKPA